MNHLHAIPTEYAGYRFRSRLEARWAVFFDSLKIKWSYEPEGYDLPFNGKYLPDFFLPFESDDCDVAKWPGAGRFIEIKGFSPTGEEIAKVAELSFITKHNCAIVTGLPGENFALHAHRNGYMGAWEPDIEFCKDFLIDVFHHDLYLLMHRHVHWGYFEFLEGPYLSRAIKAARSARFEFEESRT